MKRILGLDYGTVRIGVAFSDQTKTIATASQYINAKKGRVIEKIKRLITDNECGGLVIGLPISLNGQDTQKTNQVRAFSEALKKEIDIPLTFWDERLTSYAAENILIEANVKPHKRKEKKDSLAAQIILQEYLDSIVK